jgi:hypothetical protein
MLDCRDNGDPLQLAFVKVVIGTLFSPLAMILSVLHDYFPCPMLPCGVGGYGATECLIAVTMGPIAASIR